MTAEDIVLNAEHNLTRLLMTIIAGIVVYYIT